MHVMTVSIPAQEKRPATRILHVDKNIRVVSFTALAGQSIPSHVNDGSVTLIVLEGRGVFTGRNDEKAELGPGEMVAYEPHEPHGISSTGELLRFVAFIASVRHESSS